MKLAIGLTGGIGSGKSTVAARFAELGATIVDADEISHVLTRAGGAVMAALSQAFGPDYLTPEGALDRAAMRRLAFSDPGSRERLEATLHPLIRAAAEHALESATGPYSLFVVPLLFETRASLERVCRVLLVDCPEELQVLRTAQRSVIDREAVRSIMATQWPRWRRLQLADDVVWNGGDPEALGPQCERLHRAYRAFAGA